MSKKHQIIISTIVITALLVVAAWFAWPRATQNQPAQQSSSAAQFKADYVGVADDNRFVVSTPDEVLKAFESGDGLIFLGFKECPWCQKLAPIVDEAAKAENLDKIYYLDIESARENNDVTYQKIVAKLKDYLNKDENGNPRIYVPDVTAIKDGKIIGHFLQETAPDGKKLTVDQYWTTERRDRALEQMRVMIREIMGKSTAADKGNKIKADLANGAILLDVRTKEEYDFGHFKSAVLLPVADLNAGKMPNVDRTTTIYVYCRSSNRSATAKELLDNAGFKIVIDLGGLDSLERLGLEKSDNYQKSL